ncbi:hypothetical protein FE394_07065 [Xenorhabdus sp. Reich]|uniref:Restriction endonuclease n=1 Tax=Xenorhabdus littoralis TaxID=2582835 RepID=A0ABU4SJY9_9GAMM|nr:hypothetical protein [Xenorhabdus sp. Reich]
MANKDSGWLKQQDETGYHFIIDAKYLPTYRKTGSSEKITLILYKSSRFRDKSIRQVELLDESEETGQFNQELIDALDISDKKILLWTAYSSASRGINFFTKQDGKERDFELFCLLNNPFYTRHTRPGSRGFSIAMFQSFVQVIRDKNEDWAAMSRGDLLFQYSRNRWKYLRKEHDIDITRTVFQAIGRGERRPKEIMAQQLIYLSSEAIRTVHLGLKHVDELRQRASPAQRAVLQAIDKYNSETAIFITADERKSHLTTSLKLSNQFRRFTSDTPKRFRSDKSARATWSRLFDPLMFTNPDKYLSKLKIAGIPSAFRDACYIQLPLSAEIYTREFSMVGMTETVITDAFDGTDIFNWVEKVMSDSLKSQLSSKIKSLLKNVNGFKVETPEGMFKLLPQPWFVTDIMKGYIAELVFEEYVRDQFGVVPNNPEESGSPVQYFNLDMHSKEAELYQLYDYYLSVGNNTLVAIDIKNWTRSTDRMKKAELEIEAVSKHKRMSHYFPDKTIHAVYVNLYGAHKFNLKHPNRGTIRFMSLYIPNTIGASNWVINSNMVNVLLGK